MNAIAEINDKINSFVWGPIMLTLLVGAGIYYSLRLGLFQVSKIPLWVSSTFGRLLHRQEVGEGAVTPFQALTTALAATVGTGNMVGVATAIVSGGPGAVFWMWVSAFFGMMTKYAEIVLSVHFRRRNDKGEWVGGPMHYISAGLGKGFTPLAYIFAAFGSLAAFGIGNMTQINSIATSTEAMLVTLGALPEAAPDGGFSAFKLGVGVVLAIVAALVIIGGLKRIASVTEKLVPFMSVLYIIGGVSVLVINRHALAGAFSSIWQNAFTLRSAAGGALGYTMMGAMRFGVARGVFSNEAGLGSAPIAHAAAHTDSPVKQGMWGIFEVFVDTLVICTLTALVVLSSGVFTGPGSISGTPLTSAAFSSAMGAMGSVFVALLITLFAFSTVLSWSLYGQRCFEFLTGGKGIQGYRVIFVLCIVVASIMQLDLVWAIADTLNGLMAIPNLVALVALSGVVIRLTKEFLADRKQQQPGE